MEQLRKTKGNRTGEPREAQDYDVVYAGVECPKCGENRVDFLAINEGEVTCATAYEVE